MESGTFRIEIGASSRDIRLSAKVEVEGTAEIPVVFTPATPLEIVLRHPHGRAVVQAIRERRAAERGEDPDRPIEEGRSSGNMGAAEGEMVSHMIAEMPLSTLLSLGGMQPAQLDSLIEMLNAQGKDQ